MHRSLTFALALALAPILGSGAAAADPPGPRVYESEHDDAITEGETTLAVDPDIAYQAAADYARWPAMFPMTIRSARITHQKGVEARVTFVHHSGHRDNLHFRNQPTARMVWFEDTGGRAEVWAEIVFAPGDRPGTTRLKTRLYADVHGLASLFVSNRKLRELRQQRVRDTLVQLQAYFARTAAAPPATGIPSQPPSGRI